MKSLPQKTLLTTQSISKMLFGSVDGAALKKTERWVSSNQLNFSPVNQKSVTDEHGLAPKKEVIKKLIFEARKKRKLLLYLYEY